MIEKLLAQVVDPVWWLSVVIAGVVVGLVTNFTTFAVLQPWWSRRAGLKTERRARRRQEIAELEVRLRNEPATIISELQLATLQRIQGFVELGMTIASLLFFGTLGAALVRLYPHWYVIVPYALTLVVFYRLAIAAERTIENSIRVESVAESVLRERSASDGS